MSSRIEVRVDRELCAASGLCLLSVPEVFDQSDDDGKVLLNLTHPEAELIAAVRAVAARCPAAAITLHAGAET